jgi:tRNA(Ile)-lysidine synthase
LTDLAARLTAGLGGYTGLALAVSGGGDSMALLHLAAPLRPRVVTVDHGLRPEAAAEAVLVADTCKTLGLEHQTLHWHWDGKGNLQDAARRGRRTLIAGWARGAGVQAVALGHTRDDVAETFLMRLARGAGVDGLAAMSPQWTEGGITWLRPLLTMGRAELRSYLTAQGAQWVEDPSNDNPRFDRVRVRKAMQGLGGLGLTTERLAEVAGHLGQARQALERATNAAAGCLTVQGNAVLIDLARLAAEEPEVQRRLILRVIAFIGPQGYGPRGAALQSLLARVLSGKPAMLAGCRFQPGKPGLWAFREARAVAATICPAGDWWDGHWRIDGPPGAQTRALGTGITLCPTWRDTGLPRAALLASPSLWLDGRLIAAPHAGLAPETGVQPLFPAAALHHSLLSH